MKLRSLLKLAFVKLNSCIAVPRVLNIFVKMRYMSRSRVRTISFGTWK